MIDPRLAPFVDQPERSGLLLDYDGSLAPIVDEPERAAPHPDAAAVLSTLGEQLGLVAVVSGRPVEFLARALTVDGVTLVGQYGLERLEQGQPVADPRVEPYLEAVATASAEAEAAWPDLYVERKGKLAVTLHWRTAEEEAAGAARWADEAGARLGLAVYPTRMAVELRPPIPVDKGTVVASLVAGFHAVAFAGDDHGDLAAFDAVDRLAASGSVAHGVRIGVRSSEAPPALIERADLTVDGPGGLLALLSELEMAISRRPGPG
jgi:trehalose 6-phosphate phosphatase